MDEGEKYNFYAHSDIKEKVDIIDTTPSPTPSIIVDRIKQLFQHTFFNLIGRQPIINEINFDFIKTAIDSSDLKVYVVVFSSIK